VFDPSFSKVFRNSENQPTHQTGQRADHHPAALFYATMFIQTVRIVKRQEKLPYMGT